MTITHLTQRTHRFFLTVVIFVSSLSFLATDALAVSQAAALFLRVPIGARAAGMGQAYVAVADDITATHWNPAGLGASPMSAVWIDLSIPHRYRPAKKFISIKRGSGSSGFSGFEVWLLTENGVVMYDGHNWLEERVYEASPDEELETIVRRYLQISDQDEIKAAMAKVALANNARPLEYIEAFQERALAAVADNKKWTEELTSRFEALKFNYGVCKVNWQRLWKSENRFNKDIKDSQFSEQEFDRLSVGLDRASRRFLPEEVRLPFLLGFDGEITALESSGKYIWVGATDGLHRYDGSNWIRFQAQAEDEQDADTDADVNAKAETSDNESSRRSVGQTIPSNNVTFLSVVNKRLFIGTDKGLVEHFGISWDLVGADAGLPQGYVSAMTLDGASSSWVVVDGDVYHLSDGVWKNYTEFTVSIDETTEAIAANFSIYGTASEREKYLAKLNQMNGFTQPVQVKTVQPVVEEESAVTEDSLELTEGSEVAGEETSADESSDETSDKTSGESEEVLVTREPSLGDVIRAPFVAEIKGKVNALYSMQGKLWIGTGEGLLSFNGKGWDRYGYRSFTAERDMSVTEVALQVTRGDSASALMVADRIRNQNDLDSDQLAQGETIWVYRNAAGSEIHDITRVDGQVYIATARGALIYDGQRLRPFDGAGLGRKAAIGISDAGGATWYATDSRVAFLRPPKRQIGFMYTPWLPELADDLNYQYVAFMQNIRGAGTFAITYRALDFGTIQRTDESGNDDGTEHPLDLSIGVTYGLPLNSKTSFGASLKLISSKLASIGAVAEVGKGSATGLALDAGVLHRFSERFNLGVALTNIGPNLSFVDAEQSDPIPLNLAIGTAVKVWRSDLIELLVVTDGNFSLVEDKLEPIWNGGAEIKYANFIAFRMGRINDNAGQVKTWTFGAGLNLNIPGLGNLPFDMAYIPSSEGQALSNTLITSLRVVF